MISQIDGNRLTQRSRLAECVHRVLPYSTNSAVIYIKTEMEAHTKLGASAFFGADSKPSEAALNSGKAPQTHVARRIDRFFWWEMVGATGIEPVTLRV